MDEPQHGEIAALVSARICHDLINPLSAIGNGIELLGLTSAEGSAELELLQRSVQSAQARLQFLRIAFGSAKDDTATVDATYLSDLIARLTKGQRHQIFWKIKTETRRSDAQLICLMLLCAMAAMPLGGRLCITHLPDSFAIKAETNRVDLDPQFWQAILQRIAPQEINARTIQFPFLINFLIETGKRADVAESEDGFEFRVTS